MLNLCQSHIGFSMKKALKISIPILILLFLVWVIIQNWFLVQSQLRFANPIQIIFSLIIILIINVGGVYLWYKILKSLSSKILFKEAFRIFIVSNFGRFIPGIFIHYVARVYMAKKLGLSVKIVVSSVFLEAYYTLAGAMIVGLISIPTILKLLSNRWLLSEELLLIIIFLISLFILLIPAKLVCKILLKLPIIRKYVYITGLKQNLWEHWGLVCISSFLFILYGLAFYFLSSAFLNNNIMHLINLISLLSISWIIGFLTPIAPGGLGVSDLSFAYFISPFYGFAMASFLAVVFRLCLLLIEGVMFIIVIKISKFNIISPINKKIK